VAITEVTWRRPQEADQARPVSIGHGEFRGEMDLARLIEGLPVRGKDCHESQISVVDWMPFV
jgi:hypothetical protein